MKMLLQSPIVYTLYNLNVRVAARNKLINPLKKNTHITQYDSSTIIKFTLNLVAEQGYKPIQKQINFSLNTILSSKLNYKSMLNSLALSEFKWHKH